MKIEYYLEIKAKLEKKTKKVDELMNATPLVEIIKIQKKAQNIIKSDTFFKEKAKKINKCYKEIIKQRKIYKRQCNWSKLLDFKAELRTDLHDCETEIYRIKRFEKKEG